MNDFPVNDQHRAKPWQWETIERKVYHAEFSVILELRDRIEALEAAQQAQPNYPASPGGSLLLRVACADGPADAIREIAAWFREQGGPIALEWAIRLELEAEG